MFNGYFNDNTSKRAGNIGASIGAKLVLMVILVAVIQYYGRQYIDISDEASIAIAFVIAFIPKFALDLITSTINTSYKMSSEGVSLLQQIFKRK